MSILDSSQRRRFFFWFRCRSRSHYSHSNPDQSRRFSVRIGFGGRSELRNLQSCSASTSTKCSRANFLIKHFPIFYSLTVQCSKMNEVIVFMSLVSAVVLLCCSLLQFQFVSKIQMNNSHSFNRLVT